MKKSIPVVWIITILMLLIMIDVASAGDAQTQDLELKIYEISSLRAKIVDKIDQAIEMQDRLELQLTELRDEIRSEQVRSGIYSYPEAAQNLRIRYNLGLIQILLAYVDKLKERIVYFQNGNEHLKFLLDQIKDDMAIINILEKMETDHLTDRINRALNEFGFETKQPVFNVTDIRIMPIEDIWERSSHELRLD